MGDRGATPPIGGALDGFTGPVIPLQVAYFAESNRLTAVSLRLNDPASGGTVVVELNTASDGSGSGITVTIADGDRWARVTGSVDIAAGGALHQRITSVGGTAYTAGGLSGEYEVERSSGVTTLLSTLALVKLDANISGTDADRDSVINTMIAGVSKRMQDYMDRPIVQTTATDEKLDSDGDVVVQTRHYPIISVSALTENAVALVEDTDFELNEEDLARGQIVRISGDYLRAWARGRRIVKLTYVHGYAAVPDSLVTAATDLVVLKYFETVQSGKAWRGLSGKGVDPGATGTYDKDIWTRETVPTMAPYRRMVA